jgi:lipoate-protein ligase B
VHISRGISTHGFAVNVENDLDPFSWVIACGLPDVEMTSIASESQADSPAVETDDEGERLCCFRKRIADDFCAALGCRQRIVAPRRLGIDAPIARPSSRRVAVAA